MKSNLLVWCLALAAAQLASPAMARGAADLLRPHLETRHGARQLVVDGKPFLMLAGELHNSSSTSRAYMKPIWPQLAQRNLNTVLAVDYLGTHRAARRPLRFHHGGRLHPGRPAKSPAPGHPLVRQLEERRIVLPALLGEGRSAALPVGERPRGQDLEHSLHFRRRHPRRRRAGLRRLDAPHPPGGRQGAHGPDDAGGERGRRAGRFARPHCPAANEAFARPVPEGFDELSGRGTRTPWRRNCARCGPPTVSRPRAPGRKCLVRASRIRPTVRLDRQQERDTALAAS